MRTLKTLAAFGALLLVASGANASLTFSVSAAAPDADTAQEMDVTLTVTGGTGLDVQVMSFDWLLNGAAIPLSAVELPGGGLPDPPGGPAVLSAANCPTGSTNQFLCSFGGGSGIGTAGSNSIGNDWAWSFSVPPGIADGVYSLGRLTFTAFAGGNVSIGDCLILTPASATVPCGSNQTALNPIPEPTTAALIGLGLFGLVMGGRRR
jgi:hypothetical protein